MNLRALALMLCLFAAPLRVQAQTLEIHSFTNLNKAVPDGNAAGVSDVQTVSSAIVTLTAVRVKLKTAGQFNGDLYGYVRHISGRTNFCVLLNRVGRADTNAAGYADSGFDITLDDAASNGDIHIYRNLTTPAPGAPLTNSWQPDGRNVDPSIVVITNARTTTLSSFTSVSGGGEWTLFLADVESGGTNMLVSWELQLNGVATPAVTWATPADIVYGTPLSSPQLNASSPVPGIFTYTPAAGTVLNAGSNQTLSVTFIPTDSLSFTTVTTNVSINVQKAALTVTAVSTNKIYGAAVPALGAAYSGFVNGDTTNKLSTQASLSATANTLSPVGAYPITAGGASSSNYTLAFVSGTLTVTPAPLTITANNTNKIYGAAVPGLTASYSGFVNGDTAANLTTPVNLATTATLASPVGNYPITASGASGSNYAIAYVSGILTITRAPLTVTANDTNKVYGAAVPTFTASYSGFVNGDTAANLTTPVNLATTATAASPVGGYPITASGASGPNYSIGYVSGTLTVTAAPLTVRANNTNKLYGAAVPALSASYSGFVNGDTASSLTMPVSLSTTATAGSPVGNYPITASGGAGSNYTLAYASGTLTVMGAPLTITANNTNKIYGAAASSFTASYSGFVNGDTAASLTTPVSLATTATTASPVGSYPITASGAIGSNYTIIYVSGTLTVSAAPLTITANNTNKVFGAVVPTFTASYTGFVNGDTASSLTMPVSMTTTATANSSVGTYPITASGASGSNYSIASVSGTLTVTPATATGILTSSANPSLPGQLVTFTMSVSAVAPGAGTAAGTVQFKIDGTNSGSPVALSGGAAPYGLSNLVLGTHTVSAEYGGSGNFFGTTNTLSPVQLVNTPPVGGPDTIYRWAANGTKVSVASLLGNDSDADGDALSFLSLSATSANGAGLLLSNGWVFYTPAAGFTNTDTFTYLISDGRGAPVAVTVTVAISIDTAPSPNLVITALGGGSYQVRFDGIPGRTYHIQYSEDLTVWLPLSSGTADSSGLFVFIDTPPPASPARFYRAVYP